MPPSPHPYVPHAQPISFFLILSPAQYWVRSTNHLAPCYAISSIPRYLVPPRSKYSPQHHVLKHPPLPFLPQCQWPSFTPIQNTGKIIVLYILSFKFLDSNLEDKRFCTKLYHAFPDLNLLLISSGIEFLFVKVVPKYLNSCTLLNVLLSILKLWICPAIRGLLYLYNNCWQHLDSFKYYINIKTYNFWH